MQERVKVFTFLSGRGETIAQAPYEDPINEWLSTINGRLVQVSQSESERADVGQHVTICVWYVPEGPTA